MIPTILLSMMVFLVVNIISIDLYSCFTLPKLMALRLFTLSIFLSWIFHYQKGLLRPVNKWIIFFAGGFLCWMLTATTFSMELFSALQGGYNVQQGLFTQMLYVMLFVMVATLPIDKLMLSRAVVNAMVLLAVYAMLQYFDIDPYKFSLGGRPASFTGNPVPMAGAILLALPFSIYLAVKGKGIGRVYWSMTIFLFCAVIASCLSRGVMLGLIPVLIIMAAIHIKENKKEGRLVKGVVVVFFASIIIVTTMSLAIKHSKHGGGAQEQRYNVAELKEDYAVTARLQYWGIAWEIIKEHPFFGVGTDSFRNAYPLYRTVELDKTDKHSLNSKAHNGYLQIAATMGIPALIFYLGLVYMVIRTLWQSKGDRLLAMTFIAAIMGYMVQNISGWDELGFTPIFWTIMGVGINETS
jgi:O-antigen ligase